MKKTIVLLLALCLILMTACGASGPSAALQADLENAKASPEEIMGEMGDDGFGEKATEALIDKVLEFEYELGEESIDGDTATVETTITTYPFGQMFTNVVSQFVTDALTNAGTMTDEDLTELMDKLLMDELNKAEKTYTKTIDIELVQEDGVWVVQESEEMSNALTGGMLDFAESMSTEE